MPVFTGFGFQYFGFSVLWVCLSGLVSFPSVVFELFQSSPESGDGLSQLVDFLFLLGYLRLDAGRIPAGRYSSASLSATSRLCLGTTRW